ncbi:MAG: DUF4442 domain-containing protein [Bdellovibrionales bacterium]|nr:DUF4442 domain-containing protein [Bdellovibrionales bacterium]
MKKWVLNKLNNANYYAQQMITPTLKVRGFGLTKIPLIFIVGPKVLQLDHQECKIKIPLNRITRNHANCMYFGALAIGADLACGLLAMHAFQNSSFHFLFKDVKGEFLKRCESDAIFHCADGDKIHEAVEQAIVKNERINIPLSINVYAPETLGEEKCAEFIMTLSIKAK